jgi:hypothetical protein
MAISPTRPQRKCLQNLRQIERSLSQIDELRSAYGKLIVDAKVPADQLTHRLLRRLQLVQQQVIESANALQKVATDFLGSPSAELVESAANLLVLLSTPRDAGPDRAGHGVREFGANGGLRGRAPDRKSGPADS